MIKSEISIQRNIIRAITVLLFVVIASSFTGIFMTKAPLQHLHGQWKEQSWAFEIIDRNNANDLDADLKSEVCRNLIVHKAEIWNFSKNNRLNLIDSAGNRKEIIWNLKGRGHILELRYNDTCVEDYQIQEVSNDKLILQFSSDLQVRGIVKMTFKKEKD